MNLPRTISLVIDGVSSWGHKGAYALILRWKEVLPFQDFVLLNDLAITLVVDGKEDFTFPGFRSGSPVYRNGKEVLTFPKGFFCGAGLHRMYWTYWSYTGNMFTSQDFFVLLERISIVCIDMLMTMDFKELFSACRFT